MRFWLKKSENFPVSYVWFRCKIYTVVHNGLFYIHIHNVCISLEFDSLWKCSFSGTIYNSLYFIEKSYSILGIFNVLYFKPIHQFWELWRISIWGKVPFWISLLNSKSLGHETWLTSTCSHVLGISFLGKVLHDLEDWSPKASPFLIWPLTTINQKPIIAVFVLFFWRFALRRSKLVNNLC